MTMPVCTHDHIRLVKKTWSFFRNMNPQIVGEVFYSKLFLDYPELENLYRLPPSSRDEYLMKILGRIVGRLERRNELLQVLAEPSLFPNDYRLSGDHFTKVTRTLLWTLEKGLGSDWNKEVEEAWKACIALVEELNRNRVE